MDCKQKEEVEYFCSGRLYVRRVGARVGVDDCHVSTGYFSFRGVATGNDVKFGEIFDYCVESIKRDYKVQDDNIHIETLTIYK